MPAEKATSPDGDYLKDEEEGATIIGDSLDIAVNGSINVDAGKEKGDRTGLETPSPLFSSEDQPKDIETGEAQPHTTSDEEISPADPNVVDFNGPNDPTIAVNWALSKKWSTVAILSLLTLVT